MLIIMMKLLNKSNANINSNIIRLKDAVHAYCVGLNYKNKRENAQFNICRTNCSVLKVRILWVFFTLAFVVVFSNAAAFLTIVLQNIRDEYALFDRQLRIIDYLKKRSIFTILVFGISNFLFVYTEFSDLLFSKCKAGKK